jgi:hypothetical protein
MKIPKNNKGRVNKFAIATHKFWSRSVWVRWLFAPLVTGVLPVVTTAYYSNKVFGEAVRQWAPAFTQWLDTHAWLMLILAFVYPTLLIAFARFVMKRVDSNGINQDVLLTLVASLDQIVGCKARRFGDHVVALNRGATPGNAEQTFDSITQPQTQIAEITRGVCTLFNALLGESRPKTLIRVVLAEIGGDKVVSTPVFFPEDEPVRADMKVLNHRDSTIMTALRTKKIVIVESTLKETKKNSGRRYVASEDDDSDSDGSIICYPIRHGPTNSIPFVLSIHSDESGVLNKEHAGLYKHLLERFENRINLEYSLLKIKEGVTA